MITNSRISLGVRDAWVSPLSARDVANLILSQMQVPSGFTIGNFNLHGLYVFMEHKGFEEYTLSSSLVLADGFPIAVLAAIRSRSLGVMFRRVGSTDWLEELLQRPEFRTRKIICIGGTETSSARTELHMRSRYRADWTGIDGFSGADDLTAMSGDLASADLVLVSMGMPKQEQWILDNRAKFFPRAVVANVGGLVDYYSGTQQLAPRWIGVIGLEWVYRLVHNPRRLAHRYLAEPFKLVGALIRERG